MTTKLRRGATTIEMTLIGIPIMFILISTFEISRGMWMYHTTAYAVKQGVRYAIVHGRDCDPNQPMQNNCLVTVAQVENVIEKAGVGLDQGRTKLTFISGGGTDVNAATMTACKNNNSTWPVANGIGTLIEIDLVTPFYSMAALFWPGAKGAGAATFAATAFAASSKERIQF
jgi:Flp pilus assembly protein TadG